MNSPKRHHIVPDSYLSGFTEQNSDFVHVFSKRTGAPRRQRTNQVAVIGQYYKQEHAPAGVDKNILENYLGAEIEPKGVAALKQFISNPGSLGEDSMADFLQYLEFQRIRVPRQLDHIKKALEIDLVARIQRTPELSDALNNATIEIKDSIRFDIMKNSIGLFVPYFSQMMWQIIEAEPGASFVTSDSPLGFYNAEIKTPSEPSISMYGTKVLFPLNKRYLLLMHHPQYLKKEKSALELLPEIKKFGNGRIEISKGKVWPAQTVHAHNRIMFFLAHDIIIGESEEIVRLVSGN